MRKNMVVASIAMVVALLGATAPSHAADLVYVSGPAEQFRGYTLPAFAAPAGSTLEYLNVDIAVHNFQVDGVYGPDRPWCVLAGFLKGKCPLFWSPDAALGKQVVVNGFEDAAPGTYAFKCIHHPAQKGTVVIV